MKKFLVLIVFVLISFWMKEIYHAGTAFAQASEEGENEFDIFADEDREPEVEDEQALAGRIHIQSLFLNGNIIKISVVADSVVVPTVGLAFHLKYEKEKVYFLKYEPGEFLEDGGDPFYLVQNDNEKGKIIFGETLRRDDRFPIGGKNVVDFYFQIIDENIWDSGNLLKFEFERGVLSTLDVIRQDIQNIKWENLYLDEDGINHWQEDTKLIGSINGQANVSRLGFFSGGGIWKWLFLATLILFLAWKFAVPKLSKNKDKKRHMLSVNFK